MRIRRAVGVMGLLGVLTAAPAWAGRPLTTEDIGTPDPGDVEIELGIDYVRDGGADVSLVPGGVLLRVGVLPGLEASAATSLVILDPESGPSRAGLGDTVLQVKYRFLDETPRAPAVLGAVGLRLPTGDEGRGLGEPGVDVQPFVIVGKTFGPVIATANAGYTFVTSDRRADVVNVNASVEGQVTDRWTLVAEIVTELATSRRTDDMVLLRGGTVYALTKDVRVDAAVAFGATRASPDVVLTLGITIGFDRR